MGLRSAAFFDLDGTLLAVNSGALWMKHERANGRLTTRQVAEALLMLTGYRFGVIDMDSAMRKALQTVRGLPEEAIREKTRSWYGAHVRHHAAPGAWPVIELHRQSGHLLVLLTSSSPYESEVAREHFALDVALSTRYEVRDGRFTGEIVLPMCYGQGKVVLAERLARERGIDLQSSFFYSDSITDLPMLERVGCARPVDPDLRLRLEALRRRWPVLTWR